MKFLIDEDLPRSTSKVIHSYGYQAIDVRDLGLRGAPDTAIAAYARAHNLCILTGDFDLADVRFYPPVEYSGIVVLNVPKNATATYILDLVGAFLEQQEILTQLSGKLAIVERGRVRLR